MTQPSARERIEDLWDRATPVAPLLDAHQAEVRADAIDTRQDKLDAEIRAEYGELDRDTELESAATRAMAKHLRRMAEEGR
ncbi:hypothetical protein [Streptomyces misionensis]|uniref:hypothetical protein n=1 Tax=Streptomyces misionensis TaxID=67331 RepID=UPI0036AC7C05